MSNALDSWKLNIFEIIDDRYCINLDFHRLNLNSILDI